MAKIVDINKFHNRFERNESRKRVVGTRNLRVYFLIVCEGQKTEPLNRVWAGFAKDMHDLLIRYGNEAQAIKWAEKLANTFDTAEYTKHNPCTMVFRLVDELNNPGKVLDE